MIMYSDAQTDTIFLGREDAGLMGKEKLLSPHSTYKDILGKRIQPLDDLICWWKIHRSEVCKSPHMFKEYDVLTKNIEDNRRKIYDVMVNEYYLASNIQQIYKLRQSRNNLKQDLASAQDLVYKRYWDNDRRMKRINHGFPVQVLVTRWLHEAGFRITNIEVKKKNRRGKEHSFDAEIGDKYCAEIWYSNGVMAYERDRYTDKFLSCGGVPLCIEEGRWNKNMKYISKGGGIGDDTEANWCKLMDKVNQLPENRVGFVIACTHKPLPGRPIILSSWGSKLPPNKCVIVLQFETTDPQKAKRRGSGYVISSPEFNNTDTAENIIRSLKFERGDDNSLRTFHECLQL